MRQASDGRSPWATSEPTGDGLLLPLHLRAPQNPSPRVVGSSTQAPYTLVYTVMPSHPVSGDRVSPDQSTWDSGH